MKYYSIIIRGKDFNFNKEFTTLEKCHEFKKFVTDTYEFDESSDYCECFIAENEADDDFDPQDEVMDNQARYVKQRLTKNDIETVRKLIESGYL